MVHLVFQPTFRTLLLHPLGIIVISSLSYQIPPPYTVFRARRVTFFLVNRVEHQKLNQTTPYGAVWLSFWCSTRPSAYGGH